ncbi:hypothetical protein CEXT_118361 [Caerostris extrusa]|uniref:Uncharacterized protein n=1 Tax=Caerostris extrusa TaxID=172846 RepID=A0AAV4UG38_CAEEX|nr:hypothetical protein CEXT_118361 [Caerostris extrusa]
MDSVITKKEVDGLNEVHAFAAVFMVDSVEWKKGCIFSARSLEALVTDTSPCTGKQTLASPSETSDRKVLSNHEEALQQPKEKHRNRIVRASRFQLGTANARHTEMSSFF